MKKSMILDTAGLGKSFFGVQGEGVGTLAKKAGYKSKEELCDDFEKFLDSKCQFCDTNCGNDYCYTNRNDEE